MRFSVAPIVILVAVTALVAGCDPLSPPPNPATGRSSSGAVDPNGPNQTAQFSACSTGAPVKITVTGPPQFWAELAQRGAALSVTLDASNGDGIGVGPPSDPGVGGTQSLAEGESEADSLPLAKGTCFTALISNYADADGETTGVRFNWTISY